MDRGRVDVVSGYHPNHDASVLTQFDSARDLRGGVEETEEMNDGPGRVYVVSGYHLDHDASMLTQFDSTRDLRGRGGGDRRNE